MFFTLRHFLRTVNWKVLWETKTVVLWSCLQKTFAFCPFQSLTASLLIYFHCSGISFTCNLLHFFCFTEDNGVSKWQTTPLHIEKHMESARYMWRIMLESRADVRNVKPLKIWWDRKRVDTERGEKECSAYRMAITSDTLWISPGWAGPLPRGRHKMSLSMSHSEPLNLKERERERERACIYSGLRENWWTAVWKWEGFIWKKEGQRKRGNEIKNGLGAARYVWFHIPA